MYLGLNGIVTHPNGGTEHWVAGVRHNVNGPAVVYDDGSKSYWIAGEKLTEAEFNKRTWCMKQPLDLTQQEDELVDVGIR